MFSRLHKLTQVASLMLCRPSSRTQHDGGIGGCSGRRADAESKGKSNASNAKDEKDPSCNQQTLSLEEKEGIIGFPKMKLSEKVKVKEILNWDGKGKKDLNLI